MPDGNPIGGLYPQPPAPPQPGGTALNPLAMLPALSQLGYLAQFQKSFAAKQAVGSAFQSSVNPDGSLDFGKLSTGLKDPAAAWDAQEGVSGMLAARGQQINNNASAFNLAASQSSGLLSTLGALADNKNLSIDDVRGTVATIARNSNIPSPILNGWLQSLPTDPKALRQTLLNYRNASLGSAGVSGRSTGPVTDQGAPTTASVGQLNQGGAPAGGAPVQTALPPGQGEAIAANQQAFVADQQRAASTLAATRPLQNALPLIEKLGNTAFGPGSQGWSDFKSAMTTAGILPPGASDVEVRQEVNKYLKNYAGQTRSADRSDQALSQALGSNPHLDLTQGANLALVKNQIGMDRMDAALPVAFNNQHPAPADKAQYGAYKSTFYQSNDPRAFSFDLMTPAERRTVVDSLGKPGSPAYQKFSNSYNLAKSTGIVSPAQAPSGQ